MNRFAIGLCAAFALVSFSAVAGPTETAIPPVSKVTPVDPAVTPSKTGTPCPAAYQLLKCRNANECLKAIKNTQMVCVSTSQGSSTPADGGRRRAVAPPKNCPKAPPGSKVSPQC
jgi:hypothetical protein